MYIKRGGWGLTCLSDFSASFSYPQVAAEGVPGHGKQDACVSFITLELVSMEAFLLSCKILNFILASMQASAASHNSYLKTTIFCRLTNKELKNWMPKIYLKPGNRLKEICQVSITSLPNLLHYLHGI